MSERTRSGYRADDAEIVERVYGIVTASLSQQGSPAAVVRRLRVLSSALADAATRIDGIDPETEALDAIDADLARILADRGARDG